VNQTTDETDDRPADATRWSVLASAAAGDPAARTEFVSRYADVVRAYLAARWRGRGPAAEIDDAVQEVLLDCLRPDGVLARAVEGRLRFRPYLYGVARMTARRFERARARTLRLAGGGDEELAAVAAPGESLSRVFDRAWAQSVLRAAARLQEGRAEDESARRRVELLRLRFSDGLAIREIAGRWGVEAAWLHHQYATARDEFRRALTDVVSAEVGSDRARRECGRLLEHFG